MSEKFVGFVADSRPVMDLLAEALAAPGPESRVAALLAGSGRIAPQIALAHISLWDVADMAHAPPRRLRYRHVCVKPHRELALEHYFSPAYATHATGMAQKLVCMLAEQDGDVHVYQASSFVQPGDWQQTSLFTEVFRPAGLADELASFWLLGNGRLLHGGLCSAEAQPPLSHTQRRDAGALLRCLGPLAEKTLTDSGEHVDLSPRQREVLQLALNGESEADIARHLHRSPHTIHSHLRHIYRHFGVTSRAELLAHFIDRSRSS
ncbi:MAG: helix-turn-helix transcriptional regulator [Phycisphaerae bacterium]|nr:helix-turn-helix transcriptional regulator [Phycisphaerae bacterium]